MSRQILLLVREPQDEEECSVVEFFLDSQKEVEASVAFLNEGKVPLKLIKQILTAFPAGFFIEAYGARHLNDGIFYEKTIPVLH